LSYLLTFLFLKYAGRHKMIDVPNSRSLHDLPTPKGGGLAIIISWYIGITTLYLSGMLVKPLYFALMSGVLLAIVSLIDDLIGLKPIYRLVVHFITAILAFYFLNGLRPLIIPQLGDNYQIFIYPFAIIGIVWFINLFNFMDGVDGFASVEAISISLVLFLFTGSLPAVLLIACITGFLFWNWPKAKIFMGDVGSTQLGFMLVVLGIYYHNTYEFSILNWIMLSSPFWFDATFTLYRRWRNREKLNVAHRKHVYQRIVQSGFSHLKVNICLIIVNCIVLLMILIYREFKFLQIPLFILTLFIFYRITRIVDKKMPF
jgi:UDP-N-acetylmuramyl pentapeptide phosphotransferase/UDP-N-acetylglucosamine-1-phosphate transferase